MLSAVIGVVLEGELDFRPQKKPCLKTDTANLILLIALNLDGEPKQFWHVRRHHWTSQG